jgi:acetylornithine deacetylase/succinyl-diaminopimelate desuccinylase-like protein
VNGPFDAHACEGPYSDNPGCLDRRGTKPLRAFYEGVRDLAPALKAQWEGLGFDAEAFLGAVGLSVPAGEAGFSVIEQKWARPTCEINGIWGGYTGAGFKTVLPAEAHAKLTFRLVGDQDPERIMASLEAHVRVGLPADCKVRFRHTSRPERRCCPRGPRIFPGPARRCWTNGRARRFLSARAARSR